MKSFVCTSETTSHLPIASYSHPFSSHPHGHERLPVPRLQQAKKHQCLASWSEEWPSRLQSFSPTSAHRPRRILEETKPSNIISESERTGDCHRGFLSRPNNAGTVTELVPDSTVHTSTVIVGPNLSGACDHGLFIRSRAEPILEESTLTASSLSISEVSSHDPPSPSIPKQEHGDRESTNSGSAKQEFMENIHQYSHQEPGCQASQNIITAKKGYSDQAAHHDNASSPFLPLQDLPPLPSPTFSEKCELSRCSSRASNHELDESQWASLSSLSTQLSFHNASQESVLSASSLDEWFHALLGDPMPKSDDTVSNTSGTPLDDTSDAAPGVVPYISPCLSRLSNEITPSRISNPLQCCSVSCECLHSPQSLRVYSPSGSASRSHLGHSNSQHSLSDLTSQGSDSTGLEQLSDGMYYYRYETIYRKPSYGEASLTSSSAPSSTLRSASTYHASGPQSTVTGDSSVTDGNHVDGPTPYAHGVQLLCEPPFKYPSRRASRPTDETEKIMRHEANGQVHISWQTQTPEWEPYIDNSSESSDQMLLDGTFDVIIPSIRMVNPHLRPPSPDRKKVESIGKHAHVTYKRASAIALEREAMRLSTRLAAEVKTKRAKKDTNIERLQRPCAKGKLEEAKRFDRQAHSSTLDIRLTRNIPEPGAGKIVSKKQFNLKITERSLTL